MKKITMIIPTYKPEYYIFECLESVKNQTLDKNEYEVIVVLNGVKEPYYTEINNYIYCNKLNNFSLLYVDDRGVSKARNIGLDNAKGKYIAFLDDDDIINEKYLEVMLETNLKESDVAVVESINFYDDSEIEIKKIEENIRIKECNLFEKRQAFSVVWAFLIPKQIIGSKRFNEKYHNSEDSLFMMEISKNIKRILSVEGEIFHYRRVRQNSASFKKMPKRYILNINLCMIKEYMKLLLKRGYNKRFILIRILAVIKGIFIQLKKQ